MVTKPLHEQQSGKEASYIQLSLLATSQHPWIASVESAVFHKAWQSSVI